MAKFSVKNLKKLAIRVLKNSNISDEAANSIADALVVAEADGIHSHGVSRLPSYCDQALSGKVNGHAKPTVSISATGALRVDAMSGFAYPAIDIALSEFPGMAGDSSIIGIAIANSHHAGVLGYHVERFAESGRVVMGFSNSPAADSPAPDSPAGERSRPRTRWDRASHDGQVHSRASWERASWDRGRGLA